MILATSTGGTILITVVAFLILLLLVGGAVTIHKRESYLLRVQ